MTVALTATDQGFFVRGAFLAVVPGRERTFEDGEKRTPGLIKLLVGDSPVTVECWDMEAAERLATGLDRMDAIALRVYARAFKDRVYWKATRDQ